MRLTSGENRVSSVKARNANKRYKTLGFKWLFERSAPICRLRGTF